MPFTSKLSPEQRELLIRDLRRRNQLLNDLQAYSTTRLGARFGVHPKTVCRHEVAMFGYREPDPPSRTGARAVRGGKAADQR